MISNNIIIFILLLVIQQSDFLTEQRRYPRVREAISQKLETVHNIFRQKNISFPPHNIFLRAFKNEKQIELWAQASVNDTFKQIKTYDFCRSSGDPGPKRMQGDNQIPEGFYFVDRFNPTSNFHLSLGINYPNDSDRILGKKEQLGGDIFIHGDCVTIGCIPITDELIKELYVIAIYTKNKNQGKIVVHLFPFKMTESNLAKFGPVYVKNRDFWNNLKAGYSYFEEHHNIPKISVNKTSGNYIVNE